MTARAAGREVLVVGTSPVALLHAIARARAGDRVTIVERDGADGGCWRTIDAASHRRVEAACHLLEANPAAYRMLEAAGLELTTVTPPPRVVLAPWARPPRGGALTSLLLLAMVPALAGRRALHALRLPRGQRSAGLAASLRYWRQRATVLARDAAAAVRGEAVVRGVVGGAGSLVSGLLRAASAEGARLERGSVALRLDPRRGPVAVVDGHERRPGTIVVTSGFSGEVAVGGRAVDLRSRRIDHRHVLLPLDPGSVTGLSYAAFVLDRTVIRATDVTGSAIAPHAGTAAQLVLVQLRHREGWDEVTGGDLLAVLRRYRFAGSSAALVADPVAIAGTAWDAFAGLNRVAGQVLGLEVLDSHGDLTNTLAPR